MFTPCFTLRALESAAEWDRYHAIRKKCLFDVYHPWIRYDPDHPDEWDPNNHPLGFFLDDEMIGTVRVDLKPDGRAIFRMVAIIESHRGRDCGSRLLRMAEAYASRQGASAICLNSVRDAVRFYSRNGFIANRWEGCTACPTSLPMIKALCLAA